MAATSAYLWGTKRCVRQKLRDQEMAVYSCGSSSIALRDLCMQPSSGDVSLPGTVDCLGVRRFFYAEINRNQLTNHLIIFDPRPTACINSLFNSHSDSATRIRRKSYLRHLHMMLFFYAKMKIFTSYSERMILFYVRHDDKSKVIFAKICAKKH